MRTPNYYRIRSTVRTFFWSSLAVGFVWLVTASVSRWDNYTCVETDVIVQPYDTLWGIAEKYCNGNIEVAVQDLITSHGSDTVRVGQVVKVSNDD